MSQYPNLERAAEEEGKPLEVLIQELLAREDRRWFYIFRSRKKPEPPPEDPALRAVVRRLNKVYDGLKRLYGEDFAARFSGQVAQIEAWAREGNLAALEAHEREKPWLPRKPFVSST